MYTSFVDIVQSQTFWQCYFASIKIGFLDPLTISIVQSIIKIEMTQFSERECLTKPGHLKLLTKLPCQKASKYCNHRSTENPTQKIFPRMKGRSLLQLGEAGSQSTPKGAKTEPNRDLPLSAKLKG